MINNVLIIEDNVNDLKWYRSLFYTGKEVSLLFYNKVEGYSDEKVIELIELLYEDLFKKVKKIFIFKRASTIKAPEFLLPSERRKDASHIYKDESIGEFIKSGNFDFYIFDSLEKLSEQLILNSGLPKEKIAILSSTSSFRGAMKEKGYRAYSKADIEILIKECL